QVPPAQGGVAQDHVLGVVVGHDVDVGAGGQGLQHGLWGRCVVQVDAGDLAGELAGAVELPGPRVDEVDGQRVPGEDACELQAHVPGPEDRDGRAGGQRLEQHGDLPAAALAPVAGGHAVVER